jgi:hypothetical protein
MYNLDATVFDYELFHFIAIPEMGLGWWNRACKISRLQCRFLSNTPLSWKRSYKIPSVALIRHPCDWLFYTWYKEDGPNKWTYMMQDFGEYKTFDDFVVAYIERKPHILSLPYEYCQLADIVLRFEDMPYAFAETAKILGADPQLFQGSFFQVPTKDFGLPIKETSRPYWGDGLWEALVQTEKDVFELYDYY